MDVLWSYVSPTRISQPATLKGKAVRHLTETSINRVVRAFAAWKLLLLLVAVASPGPGYDTSTGIFFDQYRTSGSDSWLARAVEHVVLRLTRWDAFYFTTSSERGHLYEQEWAFSWLLSRVTSVVANVTTLYRLIHAIAPTTEARKSQLAFTTACLHILSPAGLFLSAPYGEATFALFNFLGLLCYARAIQNRFETFADAYQVDAFWTLGAGIWFALASTIRSNGLLSGIVFAWDVLATLPRLQHILRNRDKEQLTRLFATIAAGTILAIGFAFPQALAYNEYCTGASGSASRPWCQTFPPSIYSFVQEHYWNVGFLRYWTLSNLPLFALAFPIGWIMVDTALPSLFQAHHINRVVNGSCGADRKLQPYPPIPDTREEKVFQYLLPRLALPQIILVGMAATSFHCQILNRIASGYPLWYFILALELCINNGGSWRDEGLGQRTQGMFRLLGNYDRIPFAKPEWTVRGMVVYAIVQGGLYASFLPPA
ncbi:hypothetical protein LTR36_002414 [Oleoguttula mirabilis]|uniref:GPI mannosyltransferase 2 n=1 Tax=Oleoguttula mirabilis TaxID=1507867 RepID=A0AAV9JMW2_9PEZI|nr:hypothetical protein LTR36_002414 [Oleoguttula mirabilis]